MGFFLIILLKGSTTRLIKKKVTIPPGQHVQHCSG